MAKVDAEETLGGALESYFSDLLDPALAESELEKRLAQARLDKNHAVNGGHKGADNIVSLSSHVTNTLKRTDAHEKTDAHKKPAVQVEPQNDTPSIENDDETEATKQSVNVKISLLKKWLSLAKLYAYCVECNPEYSIDVILPKKTIAATKNYSVKNNPVQQSLNTDFTNKVKPEEKYNEKITSDQLAVEENNRTVTVQPKLQEKPILERTDNNELDIAIDLKNRNEQLQKLLNDSALKTALIQNTDVDVLPKTVAATKLDTHVKAETDLEQDIITLDTTVATEVAQGIAQPQTEPMSPWLKDEIDILLFRIGDLELALPLVTLDRVQIIGDSLSAPFGQIHWVLGLLPCKKGMIQVVDSAEFLLPEQNARDASKPYSYFISFDQSKWALAVDEIGESIRLGKERIKWRTRESATPWFTGTLRDRMCTILDPIKLQAELSNYDKTDRDKQKAR